MSAADLYRVAEIHVAAWHHSYSGIVSADRLARFTVEKQVEVWESSLFSRQGRTNFVLEDDGAIQGWCAVGPARDEDEDKRRTGEIYGLYIDPPSQGRGYGTAFLAHAHRIFRDRSYRESVLWVLEQNTPARRFYEARRYRLDTGSRTVTDRLGAPQVRYRCAL